MNRSGTKVMHRGAPELAAVERRASERSEIDRSGTAANSGGGVRGDAALPVDRLDPEVPEKAVRRRFTAEYKQSILRQADACRDEGAIGALLRREGLYSSHLSVWRRQREEGTRRALSEKRGRKSTASPLAQENARLKAENARLAQRLEQAETIIEVQKKVSTLLGIPLSDAAPRERQS